MLLTYDILEESNKVAPARQSAEAIRNLGRFVGDRARSLWKNPRGLALVAGSAALVGSVLFSTHEAGQAENASQALNQRVATAEAPYIQQVHAANVDPLSGKGAARMPGIVASAPFTEGATNAGADASELLVEEVAGVGGGAAIVVLAGIALAGRRRETGFEPPVTNSDDVFPSSELDHFPPFDWQNA